MFPSDEVVLKYQYGVKHPTKEGLMMTSTDLTPKLQSIAEKVAALRELTKCTGFQTSRSQGELLGRLTPDELAAVAVVLNKK